MAYTFEHQCISAMMKSAEDTFGAVADGLRADHFQDGGCQALFAAIIRAADRSKSTDTSAVWAELQGVGERDKAQIGLSDVLAIDALASTSAYRRPLVEKVMGAARLRRLNVELAEATVMAKQSPRADFADAWADISPVIARIQGLAISDAKARTFAELCESTKESLLTPDSRKVVHHPFLTWENRSTPFRVGQMIVFAGRPGAGKSVLCFQFAEHVSKTQGHIAAFALEMSAEELIMRLALAECENPDRPEVIAAGIDRIAKNKRFHLFDNAESYSMDKIEARCRLLISIHGSLSLVVIDYLTLVEPGDKRAPREQQVAEMSRRCKKMAGWLQCPIIVVAQLNRESEKEGRMPRMSDLRESGAIEQDADRIWFLWHDAPEGQQDNSSPNIEITLIQSKCRGGPRDIATKLQFCRSIYKFKPIIF